MKRFLSLVIVSMITLLSFAQTPASIKCSPLELKQMVMQKRLNGEKITKNAVTNQAKHAPMRKVAADGQVTEDFESYKVGIFATGDQVGPWSAIDGDNASTYGWSSEDINWQYGGQSYAFAIINFTQTFGTGENKTDAFSGEQGLMFMSSSQKACDDWFISPELSGAEQTISFMARPITTNYGPETFEVLASSTDTDPASFIKVANYSADNVDWKEFTATLPAGSKYFAIHYTSYDIFALFIDDLKYYPAQPITGVTLLANGEDEITLSTESEVSVESASAIKVGLDESIKYASYTVNEYVEEEFMGVTQTEKNEIATGVLSINTIGYAEFENELVFKLGTKYNIEIKAWDVYEDNLINPDFSIKDPVATFTCDFIGAYEEQNDLDFTDKVVKEVKANTSNIEEGKWYTWSNPRKANNQYAAPTPFYDQGEGKKPVRAAAGQTVRTVLSQNTPVSDVTKYLVRFVKSGTGEAYHIQFATGNYIKNDLTTSATAEEAGLFMVYAATNSKANAAGEPYTEAGVGINITEDGVAYGLRLDGNGAGAELVTWGNSKIETPDANNVWFFEEVEMAEPTTETYTVHITGAPTETKVTYAEQQYGDSESFDAKGFSLSQLTVPDHENYVKSVELDGTDIYVTYTYAKKVADLSEINNEHAYVLICERGQLTTNEGELAPTAEKSYTESKSVFAFVNYNENFYLWSVAEQGFVFNDKSIATEGEFQNVVFNPQEDGTFVLYIADNEHYINIDGTTNLFIDAWDTADAGNKYSIYEVETFDATDALVLLENFTTGINAVAAPAAPAAIFSLTGQRQQRLQKGINIVRRQKVIK